jgi:hypothetical protein
LSAQPQVYEQKLKQHDPQDIGKLIPHQLLQSSQLIHATVQLAGADFQETDLFRLP